MNYTTDYVKARIIYPFILIFTILCLIGVIFVFEIKQTNAIGELSRELQLNSRDTMMILRQARKNEERIKELEAELMDKK